MKLKNVSKTQVGLIVVLCCLVLSTMPVVAQQPNPTQVGVQQQGGNPIYRITVNVVQRTTKAVNYRHRSGATKVDFRGTELLPDARGEARVESQQGALKIQADMDKLLPASRFGPEYLTYVMWAITPEGRATNLGEVLLDGDKSHLDVTTELQAFGLIVTAEPYFAVTQPSDVVVMENFIRPDTVGKVEEIDAKFELLQRGQYVVNVRPADLKPMQMDKNTPIELYEARNAVQIAEWTGAGHDAADTFAKAQQLLRDAENYRIRKERKSTIMIAREAVQTAEDSRLIALKHQDDERIAEERRAAAERESMAKAQAEQARLTAETEALHAKQAEVNQQLEAEQRARAEAQAEAAKAQALAANAQADAANQRAKQDQADAERARLAALQAEHEKAELRNKLVQQLNTILETRETSRGLVITMSDVLFDTGQYTVKPMTREKLAKIAGIVMSHPGLRLQVEGHTDSVGSDEFNQRLSEKRAGTVRDYLVEQGIALNAISAQGFGKTMPAASNDTAAGRQQNRRVELILSGDVIGIPLTSLNQQQQ